MAVRTWAQLRAAFANNITGNITAADMRDFVDTVEARLAEDIEAEIALHVSHTGTVDQSPDRIPISATRTSPGTYELQCPAGWVWRAAVGGGTASTAPRHVNVHVGEPYAPSRVATVYCRNETGALADYRFSIVGRLRAI